MECAVLDEVRIWSTHRDDVSMQDFYTGGLRTTARLADALHPSVREAVEAEEAHRIGSIPAALRAMARPGTARGRSLNEAEVTPAMLAPSLRTPSRFAMPSSDLNVWARVQLRQHQVRSLPVFASEGVTSRVRWLGSAGTQEQYHRRPVGFCPGLLSVSERAQVEARFPPACRVGRFLDAYGAAMEAGYAAMWDAGGAEDAFERAAVARLSDGGVEHVMVVMRVPVRVDDGGSGVSNAMRVNATMAVVNLCPDLQSGFSFSQGTGDVIRSDGPVISAVWLHPFASAWTVNDTYSDTETITL